MPYMVVQRGKKFCVGKETAPGSGVWDKGPMLNCFTGRNAEARAKAQTAAVNIAEHKKKTGGK